MKKAFLSLLIIFFTSLSFAKDSQDPQLFILIDIDSIIIDIIPSMHKKSNITHSERLQQQGFSVQSFELPSSKSKDPAFDAFLKKSNQKPIEKNESTRLKAVETVAIRPTIQSFLEELTQLNIPTHIIICSKYYTPRTRVLVEKLNLEINNKKFKNIVDIISKEQSIVYINPLSGKNIIAKSAVEVRNNYTGKFNKIEPKDYLILVDSIPDSQFIISNRPQDLNVKIPAFNTRLEYNKGLDNKNFSAALDKIKKFIDK
jgi:hypothetical protein